jgi:hypothetical protein
MALRRPLLTAADGILAMFDALRERLLEKPDLCQDEIVLFCLDDFSTRVSTSSISRMLRSHSWTKKKIRRVAKG